MEKQGSRTRKYFKEYKVSNVMAMVKNSSKPPQICDDRCDGKLVVITGATAGIGYATAHKYAEMGADLICVNRNQEKAEALKREIESRYNVRCDLIHADLSSMEDTYRVGRLLLEEERPIDILIHNAGVHLTKRQLTEEGIEKVFMVNHLSSFIINHILMDKLKEQGKCRILLVNSEGHRFAAWGLRFDDLDFSKRRYAGLKSYGSAKLAQLLSMIGFDEYFKGSGVTINAMHPGAVKTATGTENGKVYKWFKRNSLDKTLKPVTIAADALYYLGVSPVLSKTSGKFFHLTTMEEPTPPALDRETAQILWELSMRIGKLGV